jgi:hypothetical protein
MWWSVRCAWSIRCEILGSVKKYLSGRDGNERETSGSPSGVAVEARVRRRMPGA